MPLLIECHDFELGHRVYKAARIIECELAGTCVVQIARLVAKDEVAIAVNREVSCVASRTEVTLSSSETFSTDTRATPSEHVLEVGVASAEARGVHVGDVVAYRIQASRKSKQSGKPIEE
jgi:hypothetical protein